MADAFLIIVVLILMIVMFFINLYIIAYFSHPLESKFGGSIFAKIIIAFSMLIIECEILAMPLDVSSSRNNGGLDMKGFWFTMTMTSCCFIFLVLPIAYFYSDAEGGELRSRIWHAVQMEFLFLLLSAFIVFITYPFLSKADVPVSSVDCDMSSSIGSGTILAYSTTTTSSGCSMNYTSFTIDIAFAIYFIALLAFAGWWTFVAFVGVGISAIPMDLINDFRQRPIKTDPGEFGRRRARLLQHVQNLRKDGKHLENIKESVDKGKGIKGWRNRRFYNRDLHKFESRCMIAEKEFKTLENISKLSKLEPWLYYLQFILAIVLIIMTLVWIVHIFLWILVKPAGDPVHPFLNNMLEGIRKGKVEFLSTAMFVSLFLYLILATLKGNQKFGIRFAWLTYSSMRPNRTFINSFLLNMFLVHIWTMTILQYMMKNFSMFARNTDAFKIFQIQIKYAWFYSWFWNQEFFTWVLVVWSIIAFFYLIFKPNEQLELEDQLKNKDLESNRN